MPSAVSVLHWLPSLPATGFIYSMAGIATLTSDKGLKYTHMRTHKHKNAHAAHDCQLSGAATRLMHENWELCIWPL